MFPVLCDSDSRQSCGCYDSLQRSGLRHAPRLPLATTKLRQLIDSNEFDLFYLWRLRTKPAFFTPITYLSCTVIPTVGLQPLKICCEQVRCVLTNCPIEYQDIVERLYLQKATCKTSTTDPFAIGSHALYGAAVVSTVPFAEGSENEIARSSF